MKILKLLTLSLFITITLNSCKHKEKAPKGEELVKVECAGKDYFSDKKHFRSSAVGESLDQSTAKKKSTANAKSELASIIQTTIKATIDNYVNSREMNNVEQIEERFEGLSREVINQRLSGIITVCEKTFKTAEGKYKTYICLELGADDLVEAINERLTKEESLKVDYDYEKFKETFNKEMERLENN